MIGFVAHPSRLWWKFVRFSRRVWVRVSMISALSLVAAGSAPFLGQFIPESLAERVGEVSVRPILNVLASSMLAVTTFSLSVMVAAHRAASDQVTPRSHRLLLADTTTQSVLSTFLGAFIYALVSLILINAEIFDERSIGVSFIATILVILLVVIAILRWIEHLSRLGSMLETTRDVERATERALETRLNLPYLGGRPAEEAPAELPLCVYPTKIGYVGHIDTEAIKEICEAGGCSVLIRALPGAFVATNVPLAEVSSDCDEEALRLAFSIEDARSFDQDPRFGLIVLSEIASRALSPGINDPGTAIDVIGRSLRLLSKWQAPETPEEGKETRLFVPALKPADLIDDAYGAIARDGAGTIEVQLRLQKALATLSRHGDPALSAAALEMSARSLAHARKSLPLASDLDRIVAVLPDSGDQAKAS